MLSQYIMQRDGRFYDAPTEFRPERWTEQFEKELPRGAFFPFSAGDRHCIGEGFAWQEALLILATLIERWKFELVPGQRIVPRPSVTLRPNTGIRMIVHAR
jgi:cytochrome P450